MVLLSAREQEVYDLVIERGHAYKIVGEWLGIKPQTVRNIRWRIREKHRADGQPLPDKRRRFMLN